MSSDIRAVLFDFGGVISPLATEDAMAQIEGELGLDGRTLQAAMYEGDLWPELSVGKVQEDDYWRALGQLVGREPDELRWRLRTVWEPQRVDEEVVAMAQALRSRVRVALLSNATLRLEEYLHVFGLDTLFDPIINSARVGLRKPDPEAFRYALRVLDLPPAAVLFIDDKERNTCVAQDLGIPSICFDTAANLAAALQTCGLPTVLEPAMSPVTKRTESHGAL
jgi:putative hydrolase of the HAD superfamily